METIIKIVQFIVSLSLLIIIHECGHFMFAKLFKTRVDKFYLFFDPWFSLFKIKRGDTEYGIGWLPLGGYVKISGMVDESMDMEQLKQPVQPYEFRAKPAWQRLLIMIGGVMMNVILAAAIYIGISYAWGDQYLSNDEVRYGYLFNEEAKSLGFEDGDRIVSVKGEKIDDSNRVAQAFILGGAGDVVVDRSGTEHTISLSDRAIGTLIGSSQFIAPIMPFIVDEIQAGSGAEAAGVQNRDKLIAIDSEPIFSATQAIEMLAAFSGESTTLSFERDSAGVSVVRNLDVELSSEGKIGVSLLAPTEIFTLTSIEYGLFESIPVGIKRAGTELKSYTDQIKIIFTPESGAYKSLGGFISIGSIFPTYWDWEAFWRITAFLSIALAVMNILPIPALDGGHVVFLLYEMISGRKPSDKALEIFQTIGVVLLFALLLFVNGNDIYRFFIK